MKQPFVSVDVVPLRFDVDAGLQFGVTRRELAPFAGELALPGVLLGSDGERIADAAARAAQSKAGIGADCTRAVRQLGAFDGPHRDPRGPTISIAHLLVVDPTGESRAHWLPFTAASGLPFDHEVIVAAAFQQLQNLLWSDQQFTAALTGERFSSFTAAQLVTAASGTKPDPGNLNRTLTGDPRITKLDEKETGRSGRPSTLWRWESASE